MSEATNLLPVLYAGGKELVIKNKKSLMASIVVLGIASTYLWNWGYFAYKPLGSALQSEVGSTVRTEFRAQDSRDLGPVIGVLVNDVPYRSDPTGQNRKTVQVTPDTKGYELAKSGQLRGKTVRVIGHVSEFNGKKQIMAEEIYPAK